MEDWSRQGSILEQGGTLHLYNHRNPDSSSHVIMAIDRNHKGTLGCAYYVASEETLMCMEDLEDQDGELIPRLLLQVQPSIVLFSTRVDATSLHSLRLDFQNQSLAYDNQDALLPYQIVVRPPSEFNYCTALSKLACASTGNHLSGMRFIVPGDNTQFSGDQAFNEPGFTDRAGDLLRVSSSLDVQSKLSIGCGGAIVTHLHKKKSSEYLHDDPEAAKAYCVIRMEMFVIKDAMHIDTDTLIALQIIQPESHPNSAKQGPDSAGSKESLSIFGLFQHFARTSQGRARLRRLFLQPSVNLSIINERLDFVDSCLEPVNCDVISKISKSLGSIKNLRSVVVCLRKGIEGVGRASCKIKSIVWSAILDFCYHSIDIIDLIHELAHVERVPLFRKVVSTIDGVQIQNLGKLVYDVVNLEESTEQHRTIIKRGVNEDLDRVKDAYGHMEDMLSQIAKDLTSSMPPYISAPLDVLFIPQLGFHIAVPLDPTTRQPVFLGHEEEWERRFMTEDRLFVKNAQMHNLDHELGDLWAVICDTEIELSHDLAQQVLAYEQLLLEGSDLYGELDCLLALAHGASHYRLTRPRLAHQTDCLHIEGGRNLLEETIVPCFIPNNTVLSSASLVDLNKTPRMIIMTGPNYSGKSVYLKQVALIVYMAQIGSFVPAISANLGLTDKILTRISTRESVSKLQSAFMIDLQQIYRALTFCTSRSLLIIDEFGKGTDLYDGAALNAAFLKYLLNLGSGMPKTLVSTHFHEIFEGGDFDNIPAIEFAHMSVRIEGHANPAEEHCRQITYLYEKKPGRSAMSYGAQCAAMNGIPRTVTKRAETLTQLLVRGEDLVAACSILPEDELAELEEAEAISRTFVQTDLTQPWQPEDLMEAIRKMARME